MTVIKKKIKEILISFNKMETLNKKNRRKYLSVPALNKINDEVYIEGNRSLSGNYSGSSHSVNYAPDKNLKKGRRKRFISLFFLNGSSTNEKADLSSYSSVKPLELNIEQKTWNSSAFAVHNDYINSGHLSNSSNFRNENTEINENVFFMTQAHSVSRGPTDPDGSAGAPITTKTFETSELVQSSRSSKSRQKKFHRHFKQVDIEEKVLNYYSCALVGDILLQGHLYITENFFAFYSNVFGYVTKLLIPTVDVLKISKEKTARIIPNAVGISTEDEKHVFGSLLSRDSTYKFMLEVWKSANSNLSAKISPSPVIKTDEDSSVSSGNEDPSSYISSLTSPASSDHLPKLLPNIKRKSIMMATIEAQSPRLYWHSFKVKTVLAACLILLVFFSGSAAFLFYKIAIIQNHFNEISVSPKGSDMYEDIIKWQSSVYSKSADKISEYLNRNLNQIVQVRLSLEALSMLILPENSLKKSHSNSKLENKNIKQKSEDVKVDET